MFRRFYPQTEKEQAQPCHLHKLDSVVGLFIVLNMVETFFLSVPNHGYISNFYKFTQRLFERTWKMTISIGIFLHLPTINFQGLCEFQGGSLCFFPSFISWLGSSVFWPWDPCKSLVYCSWNLCPSPSPTGIQFDEHAWKLETIPIQTV